jgi:hypothetical protein
LMRCIDYTTKLWTDFLLIELISCVMLPPENVFKSKSSGADSALASTKARLAARKSQEEDEKKKTMKNTGEMGQQVNEYARTFTNKKRSRRGQWGRYESEINKTTTCIFFTSPSRI